MYSITDAVDSVGGDLLLVLPNRKGVEANLYAYMTCQQGSMWAILPRSGIADPTVVAPVYHICICQSQEVSYDPY